MADRCTFADRFTPSCSQPATHRVCKGWLRPYSTWRIEEVREAGPLGTHVESSLLLEHTDAPVPEFCLTHAGEVMDQRNAEGRR